MAEPGDLSRPEMRPGARLHSHYTRCQVGEERQHRVPAQPLRHNHLALAINAVNLKHRLRQIETDECCGHRTISVMKGTYPSRGTDVPDAGGRPSHHAGLRAKGVQNVSQTLYVNALNFDRLLALGSS